MNLTSVPSRKLLSAPRDLSLVVRALLPLATSGFSAVAAFGWLILRWPFLLGKFLNFVF